MKTKIRTIHEEQYGEEKKDVVHDEPENYEFGDGGRILGVLENYEVNGDWKDSFIYTYNKEMYIIFNTIIEMNEFLLYGDTNIKRAYIKEENFDELYDFEIDGKFEEKIKWV